MKITNLLISQPKPVVAEKSPYYELISKYNLKTEFAPFIKVEGVTAKEFRGQRIDVSAHSAVIFTSRATIDSFFRICEECRVTVSEEMKYFCVTEAIALYLQKYIVFRKRKIFFGKGTFADLMDIVVKHKEEKFLVALADPHKPEIPKALEKAKIKHHNVILSRTVAREIKDQIKIADFDMLVFYSPVEIASLISQFGSEIPETIKIATFGASTTKAAIDAGLKVSVIAPTPEYPSMTKAIDKFINKFNNGEEIDTTHITEFIKSVAAQNEMVIAKIKQSAKPRRSKTCSSTKRGSSTKSSSSSETKKVKAS